MLSGTLAAILMTIGTLIFNRDLLHNKLDLALLVLYFELFFVLLFSLLELFWIYLVSAWMRVAGSRGVRAAGQTISFLTGLAFFAYFVYWGKTQIEFLRLLSWISLVTTVIILILSCIFVAKCSWLGFLVAFREAQVGRVAPDWRRYRIEVLLSLAAVLILLPFVFGPKQDNNQAPGPVAVLSTPERWIVIAVDGTSLEILQRLISDGALPAFQQLQSSSARGTIRVTEPIVPPVDWTTIATGVPPAEHGILTPEVRRWRGLSSWMQITPLEMAFRSIMVDSGLGQRQPVSGYLRKRKTFWEVLSDYGIRAGVVNWWGSWPARPMRGWNISERYYYKLMTKDKQQDETYPPEIFQKYFVPVERINGIDLDRFYMNVFQKQLQADPVRVGALYLPGLDILNYEFFEAKTMDPFSYTDLYRKHLEWLDSEIGKIHQGDPGASILLVFYKGRSLKNDHSAIWVNGKSFQSEAGGEYSQLDIAPLLLYTCGIPVGKTMSTSLIQAIVARQHLAQIPLRYVNAYPRKEQLEAGHVGEFNDLLIEQMKSLGYLQ